MTINDYLKDYLIKMLEFREAAGYATTTYKVTLMPFIDFCCSNYKDAGDIYIRETKKHKDRHIIMSRDITKLCREYDGLAGNRAWFFEYDGGPYNRKWMTAQFGHCWKRSGLGTYRKPRPYDLRHAFATRNLIKWIDKGLDVNNLLPYLSTYMGHSELTSTFYYIHLLPERIRNSAGIDWNQFSSIYGKEGGGIED